MEPIGQIYSHKHDAFTVHAGISDGLVGQLVAFSTSNDIDLRAFTGDAKRFVTPEDTQKWIQDATRKIYTLTPENNEKTLAGFAWLREDAEIHIPDTVVDEKLLEAYQKIGGATRCTVAARIYGRYRGMKLATPFLDVAHTEYMTHVRSEVALILADIHRENIPSQKLFARLGYQLLGAKGDRTLWLRETQK